MLAKVFDKFPKVYSAYMWFGSVLIGWMVTGLKLVMGHFHRLYKSKSEFWVCYEPLISSLGGQYQSGDQFGKRTLSWSIARNDDIIIDMKEIDVMAEDDADMDKEIFQMLEPLISEPNQSKGTEPS